MNKHSSFVVSIPNWIIWVQCICLSILYAIWVLPETILIRHTCLIIGALFGLYEVVQYRALFVQKRAIPVWLLLGLFLWVTAHLFFLSNNFPLQMDEYSGIWKRAALGAIFALGFGLALSKSKHHKSHAIWAVFYVGLLAPTIIFIIKYFLTNYGQRLGFNAPEYLKLFSASAPYYLPKTAYMSFCLPVLAVALGGVRRNFDGHVWFCWTNLIYLLTISAVFFVFHVENIKNGVVYGFMLIIFFATSLLLKDFKKLWLKKMLLSGVILIASYSFLVSHIQKNESWRTLLSDSKIAFNTDYFEHWKYNGVKGYPRNELGKIVSVTNYDRVAWGKVGFILMLQNPMGYGLVERSFGHITKSVWQDSNLDQSHSGWLDLALGIGLPGLFLVLGPLFLTMGHMRLFLDVKKDSNPLTMYISLWHLALYWILLSSLLMWCTTELSQKVNFDSLIFWIAMSAGLVVGSDAP